MARAHIDTVALYASLDAARSARNVSWRSLAKEIGVSPSLLSRLGNGLKPDADGFATLVAWLNVPAERFIVTSDTTELADEQPALLAELAPLLRARKDLTESDVTYLEQVIVATVEHMRIRAE